MYINITYNIVPIVRTLAYKKLYNININHACLHVLDQPAT